MDLANLAREQIEQAGFDEPSISTHEKSGALVVRLRTTRGIVYEKFTPDADTLYGDVAMWLGRYEPAQ